MQSSYELAMERLGQSAPLRKLTADQKIRLADLDSLYKSKIAQADLAFRDSHRALQEAGDFRKAEKLRLEFSDDLQKLEAERQAKKEKVRNEG
ncbi:MAG TPA: hypothetical protein VMB21_07610 [Candidatus Limnocylindria bacterium]|nr:hypothetical protein [Candidatus Limnocylindria bacterium]